MTNLAITEAVRDRGYYYAPDPSSQQICSIGGNVAENSGGAHCLKYGFTVNHVLALEIVTPGGEIVEISAGDFGYDLLGAFVGSEGTLGIATKITVRLMRPPEAVTTLLAAFRPSRRAARRSRRSSRAGIVPAAIEMMDALAIEAAEAAVACGYPAERRRGADRRARRARRRGGGPARRGDRDLRAAPARSSSGWPPRPTSGPRSGRAASRRFAAVGRISPAYIVQDGVVPRTSLGEVLARIDALPGGVRHPASPTSSTPATATCIRWCCSTTPPRVRATGPRSSADASSTCASCTAARSPASTAWGSTRPATCRACSPTTTSTPCSCLRCAFDPGGLSNPGKVFPTPRLCGEVPRVRKGLTRGEDLLMLRPHGSHDPRRRTPRRGRWQCCRAGWPGPSPSTEISVVLARLRRRPASP